MPTTQQSEAIKKLRETLHAGDTIYSITRSKSRSGLQRTIDLKTFSDNTPNHIGRFAAVALGCRWDNRLGGIITSGHAADLCEGIAHIALGIDYKDAHRCFRVEDL